MNMKSPVALVTGAGSGIGRAAALALARDGFKVGVLGHTWQDIASVADGIVADGHEAIPLLADISDEDQMAKGVEQLVKQFDRLDVVVANAGINGAWAPIDDLSLSEWNETIAINLTGTFLTIRAKCRN
jgi:NAD(P)-dependent dehydrogenase (short-subunit alcohol dehydrogenase family)